LGKVSETYISDLLHDRLHALERVCANLRHLVRKLRVLAALLLLFRLILRNLFLLDVLEESDFSDLVTVVVNNVAVVVNLEARAVTKVAGGKAAENVAVLITHLALFVDTHAGHGVDAALLLLGLPALSLADDIAVLVVDVTILVDLVAGELLDVTFNDTSNDLVTFSLDGTVLDDLVVLETGKGTLRATVNTLGELSTSDDVAFVVPDLSLTINLLADHGRWIALSNTAKDLAAGVDNVASFVDSAAGKSAEVNLRLFLDLRLLVWLSMALDVAVLVDDVAILVDLVTDELLLVAFGDLTNAVAI
jgi:hypothetical protein